jgi:DNA uptake protein ComE-like DNA-binding protein
MSEAADETEHLDMSAFAIPPAGSAQYLMVLVLAAGRPGQFDEVHDFAVYAQPQQFLQPSLRGAVGYRIEGDRVHLSVEHIENPRQDANRSGTLALELWALAAPYTGGSFQGVPLAGVAVGSLSGQSELATTSFALPFSRPPAGRWHFVLMLREWTAAGYVTRDFTNFDTPVSYGPSLVTTPLKASAVVANEVAPSTQLEAAKTASPAALPQRVEGKPAAAVNPVLPKTLVSSTERKPPVITAASTKVASGVPEPISINTAAEEELAAIEGLSPKLARAIIKERPFTSLDDLRGIRGVSAKLLAAIRSRLRL